MSDKEHDVPAGRTYNKSTSKYHGTPIFVGPKGGLYYRNDNGTRVGVTESETVPTGDVTASAKVAPEPAGAKPASGAAAASETTGDVPAGRTYNKPTSKYHGTPIFVGPKGGLYYRDRMGTRQYVQEAETQPAV